MRPRLAVACIAAVLFAAACSGNGPTYLPAGAIGGGGGISGGGAGAGSAGQATGGETSAAGSSGGAQQGGVGGNGGDGVAGGSGVSGGSGTGGESAAGGNSGASGSSGAGGNAGASGSPGAGGGGMCTPNQQSCSGNDVHACNASGTGTVFQRTCSGTNVQCDPLVGDCLGPNVTFPCTGLLDERRWVSGTANSFNTEGRLYDVNDLASTATVTSVCDATFQVNGQTVAATDTNWGAEVGIRLCEEEGSIVHALGSCPLPGDPSKVRGVRFTFCSAGPNPYPARIHVHFPQSDLDYGAYKIINAPAPETTYTVMMTDADVRIWFDVGTPAANIPLVRTIGWQVPAELTAQPYSFCVTNIELLGTL